MVSSQHLLDDIQQSLFDQAKDFLDSNTIQQIHMKIF